MEKCKAGNIADCVFPISGLGIFYEPLSCYTLYIISSECCGDVAMAVIGECVSTVGEVIMKKTQVLQEPHIVK
jgi:hypothetical protein